METEKKYTLTVEEAGREVEKLSDKLWDIFSQIDSFRNENVLKLEPREIYASGMVIREFHRLIHELFCLSNMLDAYSIDYEDILSWLPSMEDYYDVDI